MACADIKHVFGFVVLEEYSFEIKTYVKKIPIEWSRMMALLIAEEVCVVRKKMFGRKKDNREKIIKCIIKYVYCDTQTK